jgi:hypothetical protein
MKLIPFCDRADNSNQREDGEVQFIYKAMRQQIVPEGAAPEDHDVSAGLLFEHANFVDRIGYSDDAGVVPRG